MPAARMALIIATLALTARAQQQQPEIVTHDTGHGVATCVRHSPDGRFVATTGHDGAVRLWDTKTWKRRDLEAPKGQHWSLAFSRDGKSLAAGSDFTLRVWSVKARKKTWKHRDVKIDGDFGAGQGSVHCVTFTPDSKRLVGGMSGVRDAGSVAIRFWDLKKLKDTETGARGHTATGQGAIVEFAAFTPKGDVMASGGFTNALRVWRFEKKKRARGWHLVAEHRDEEKAGQQLGHTMCADFSPDGKLLVVGDTRGRLHIFGGEDWKRSKVVTAHPASHVREVRFSADGKLLYSVGGDLRLWNAETMEPAGTIELPAAPADGTIMSMSLAPDEKNAVCVDSAGVLHVVPLPPRP